MMTMTAKTIPRTNKLSSNSTTCICESHERRNIAEHKFPGYVDDFGKDVCAGPDFNSIQIPTAIGIAPVRRTKKAETHGFDDSSVADRHIRKL